MTLRDTLGLRPTTDPNRWELELSPRVLTPAGALHGGAALAAAVEALEGATGRPLVWATAQYLTHAGPTGTFAVDVSTEVDGRRTLQMRAGVLAEDVEVLMVLASLGARDFPHEGRWVAPPSVDPPSERMRRIAGPPGIESLLDTYDIRVASGRAPDELDGSAGPGRSALWCQLPDGSRAVGAGDIALVGDFLMLGLSTALGVMCTANSLDHTIRVVERATTEWILVDIQVDAAIGGYGHAGARLWTDEGVLLGTATQTLVLREADPHGRSTRRGRRIVAGPDRPTPS